MKIIYYGHSCFGVEVAGRRLLFDPFISPNELAKGIDLKEVKADYVLISHGHFDHVADTQDIVRRNESLVISNYEICDWLGRRGLSKTHPMNLGGSWKFDFGRVKFVSAIHSSVLPDGTYGGNPGGFVVESSEGNFYYSGDTALTMDMKLIGESTPLNLAVLCIGDNFTMGVDDAIRAAEFTGCWRVIGVHYDTFPPIKIDRDQAAAKFKAAGLELVLVPIGGSLNVSAG